MFYHKAIKNQRNQTPSHGYNLKSHHAQQRYCFIFRATIILICEAMPDQDLPPSIFHMLERNVGKKIRVILDPAYGFEGTLAAVTLSRQESGSQTLKQLY